MEEKRIYISPERQKKLAQQEAMRKKRAAFRVPRKTLVIAGIALLSLLLLFGLLRLLEAGSKKVTVYLNTNGGEALSNLSVRPGKEVKLPEPVREGYTFLGWSLDDKIVASPFSTEENVVLMAEWEGIAYVVTFDANGGSPDNRITLNYGDEIQFPSPEQEPKKAGFTLVGWADASGSEVKAGTVLPAENVTLYAMWADHMFRITFDSDGGTNVPSISLKEGDVFHAPAVPTRPGYVFQYWEDADGNKVTEGTQLEPKDITLHAVWKQTTYTVSFDTRGGSFITAMTLQDGDKLVLPAAPTKAGFNFSHWEDKDGNKIENGAVLPAENITLYAVWADKAAEISFDSRGGSAVESITLKDGETLELPDDPVREGYRFAYWEDENGTPVEDGTYLAPGKYTLYAVWSKLFTVTFDSKGGSYVEPIVLEEGQMLRLPADPVKDGAVFGGWETSYGIAITDGCLLDPEDITVYAKWIED